MSHVTEQPEKRTSMNTDGYFVEEWSITEWDGERQTYITHREDGPAYVEYFNSLHSQISYEMWMQRGGPCRLDGPVMIMYNMDGSILRYRWYHDNSFYDSLSEWLAVIDVSQEEKVRMKMVYG